MDDAAAKICVSGGKDGRVNLGQVISVVVPVYNNAETLAETSRQILEAHESSFSELGLELLFVNDGSTDRSWNELLKLKEAHRDKVTLINLSRNFGQLGALYAGFNNAVGDAVICISADLQDPISLIPKMVALWRGGVEVVVCHREGRKDGFLARIFSSVAYAVARVSSPDLPRGGFDYWLMSRRVCRLLCSYSGRHNFLQGNLLNTGFTKAFIPYTRRQREFGKSGYTLGKRIKIVIDFLVDSSYLPIRFMSCVGAVISLAGLLYSLLITYAWLINRTPFPGWAPIMIVVMIVGGIIMLMLGIIGEYIWRIYDNTKSFPLFIVDKHLPSERS